MATKVEKTVTAQSNEATTPVPPSGKTEIFLPTPNEAVMPGLRGMLGLCARARKLVLGTSQVCDTLHGDAATVKIVLEASDTSENTHKRLCDRCTFYGVPLVRLPDDGFALGHAVGKNNLSAVAVTDEQFSRAIRMKMQPEKEQPQ